jgi:hypothetical protein
MTTNSNSAPPDYLANHNGARIYSWFVNSGAIPGPQTLRELAEVLRKVRPNFDLPIKFLELMHEREIVTFEDIEVEVYGQRVEDKLYVVRKANEVIREYKLRIRLEQRGATIRRIPIAE